MTNVTRTLCAAALALTFTLAGCGASLSSSSSWKRHTTYTIQENLALELLSLGGTWASDPAELGFTGKWGNTAYATRLEKDGTTSIICWWKDSGRYSLISYPGNWEEKLKE